MSPQHSRNYSGSSQPQQQQGTGGFNYDTFQPNSTVPSNSQGSSLPTPPIRAQNFGDDGDVAMEDADPYNRTKYPSRPGHAHRPSGQYLSHEESAAARRYSPMNMTLSPSSPYSSSPQQNHPAYSSFTPQSQSARQSPTRSNPYSSPSQQYYPQNSKGTNPLI